MDPITTAIMVAMSKLSDTVVRDAYEALKAVLAQKFGGERSVATAVTDLEKEPSSAGRREVLREKVAAAGADRDEETLHAAEALTARVRALPGGVQFLQQIVAGDHNIVAGSGDVTISTGKG